MIGIVSVGDNCIDRYLPPYNKKFIGGNALNVAVHIRKAGCPSAYLGAFGNDADGKIILERLKAEEVFTERVQICQGNTAYTLVQITEEGDRQFIFEDLGPQPHFKLDGNDLEYIGQHSLVHNTWQGCTQAYLGKFHSYDGLQVSMDYGERYTQDFVDHTIKNVDLAFFSIAAGEISAAKELGLKMYARGPKLVVVTLGGQGSLALADGNFTYQPAFPVDVVDTLGAGDTYIATFLANQVIGKSIAACMELASRAAAQTCTYFGAWENSEIS